MKAFLASTSEDLQEYRDAATRAVLMASGMPESMQHWPATDTTPLDESLRRVRASDVLILLVAHRYGKPIHGQGKSVTELEFDEALAAGTRDPRVLRSGLVSLASAVRGIRPGT